MFVSAQANIGELCNGSTTDSDSVCWGSNPYSPAKIDKSRQRFVDFTFYLFTLHFSLFSMVDFGWGIGIRTHSSKIQMASNLCNPFKSKASTTRVGALFF